MFAIAVLQALGRRTLIVVELPLRTAGRVCPDFAPVGSGDEDREAFDAATQTDGRLSANEIRDFHGRVIAVLHVDCFGLAEMPCLGKLGVVDVTGDEAYGRPTWLQ